MASLKTKFTVGLFFVTGVSIAIILIIWLGMSHYLEEGQLYASYFDESVQGLGNDSPVKYRGVSIGRVTNIGVAPDGNLIEVLFKIESGLKPGKDMVARLKSIGITGIMFIELERSQGAENDGPPEINFQTRHNIIRTRPSDIKKMFDNIEDILAQVKASDIVGLFRKMDNTVDQINLSIKEARVAEVSSGIRTTFANTREIFDVKKWNRILNSLEDSSRSLDSLAGNADKTVLRVEKILSRNEALITESVTNLNVAVSNAGLLMKSSNELVQKADSGMINLQHRLLNAAKKIEEASENLNMVLELGSAQPSQLLFGEPVTPKKIEK